MPSSTEELRAEMRRRFGDLDPAGPLTFLTRREWTRDGRLRSPVGRPLTRQEIQCAQFLIEEWDHEVMV